jgi:hypothetical protein
MPSSTRTIALQNIKKDYFMIWEMSTNAANKITVVLQDDARTYVNNSSMGIPHKVLAEGYDKVKGNNLRITIQVENPQSLPPLNFFVLPYSVPRPDGTLVGHGYNIMMEDQVDGDFNDFVAFIYACNSEV